MQRREFLGGAAAALVAAGTAPALAGQDPPQRRGRIKQGVTRGVFRGIGFEESCEIAARLGIQAYDLIGPNQWPILRRHGLVPSMYPPGPGGTISNALNRVENHSRLEPLLRAAIDECAAANVPNIITFSGNRRQGLTDEEGIENSVAFLNRIKAHAEDKEITICMEHLNSTVNHRGYMFDHLDWGLEVMKQVNSPRVKILYDIYHVQIMDGDIVRSIRNNIEWIHHFHTGGNPGRNQIDETQELNYRFIMQAIADLDFDGYVVHEYGPRQGSDPVATLQRAIEICDV